MSIEEKTRKRGSEQAWLGAAYTVLTESGVDAVKIGELASRLGLTRTGFYWHFRDREELLEKIVRSWEDKNTGGVLRQCDAFAESICEAMFNLMDCWLDNTLFDARLDLAIRNWAHGDPPLQLRVSAADQRRIDAIAAMFARFGYAEDQARLRSMVVIYTQIGYSSMHGDEDDADRIARMLPYVELLTGQTPSGTEIERFIARHGSRS